MTGFLTAGIRRGRVNWPKGVAIAVSLENLDVRGRHLASPSSFGGLGTGPMDPPELLKVRTGSWPRRRCWQAENVGTELSRTKVLFVCDQNRLRSPTAEALFAGDPTLEVRSAGCRTDATAPITREALEWADVIFVMERNQRNVIRKRFEDIYQHKKIICLYIEDMYEYMDPDLVGLLTERVQPHLPARPSP